FLALFAVDDARAFHGVHGGHEPPYLDAELRTEGQHDFHGCSRSCRALSKIARCIRSCRRSLMTIPIRHTSVKQLMMSVRSFTLTPPPTPAGTSAPRAARESWAGPTCRSLSPPPADAAGSRKNPDARTARRRA